LLCRHVSSSGPEIARRQTANRKRTLGEVEGWRDGLGEA
jgi:hypothetical protein